MLPPSSEDFCEEESWLRVSRSALPIALSLAALKPAFNLGNIDLAINALNNLCLILLFCQIDGAASRENVVTYFLGLQQKGYLRGEAQFHIGLNQVLW